MGLQAIRRTTRPGLRPVYATLSSVLLMLVVSLGLIAMHDAGVEHVAHAEAAAAPQAEYSTAHDAPAQGVHSATGDGAPQAMAVAVAAATTAIVAGCDSSCASDLLGCAAAAMACAMMIAFAVVLALASRPAVLSRLQDAGGLVPAVIRDVSVRFHRPDLHVLSISRT